MKLIKNSKLFFKLLITFVMLSIIVFSSYMAGKTSFNSWGDRKIKSERELSRGSIKFGYGASELGDGDWSEAPDGIKEISMNTKLIQESANGIETDYFLAYQYFVQLEAQDKKLSKNDTYPDIKGSPIAAYCIEFDFYLLDADGYCLMEINTDKAEKQTSPNYEHFIMVEKEAKGSGQVILNNVRISQDVANRTKKIVYWPQFRIGMWDYIEK